MLRGLLHALLLGLALACAARAGTLHLRVAVYRNPPLLDVDASRQPRGIFIDVLRSAASQHDWDLTFVPVTFDEGLKRLLSGQVDLMPNVALTPERREVLAFNREPVISMWGQVYAPAGSTIRSIADLRGARVAGVRGMMQLQHWQDAAAAFGAHPVFADDYAGAVQLLRAGEADALLANPYTGSLFEREAGLVDTRIMFAPFGSHFAAPQGASAAVLDTLDRQLLLLKADPQSAYFRALDRLTQSLTAPRLPPWAGWAAAGTVLLLCTSAGWALTLLGARNRVRRSEAAQRRAAEELQHVFEHSMDVIAVLDEDLRIERVSPACERLWGIAPGQLVGHSPFEFTRPQDREALSRTIEAIRNGTANASFETRGVAADGSRHCMVWSGVWSDAHRRMYCVGRDDTHRRELVDTLEQHGLQLQQANEDLRSFSQSVSHDLRAPLAAIKAFVAKALHDGRGTLGERSILLLEKALAAEDRMEHLIADLLRFARISDHGLERRACDLAVIASEVVDALREAHPGARTQVRVDAGLWTTADPQLLRVALENLLGNAWKFSAQAPAPALHVGQEMVDGEAVFFVRDNGAGFDMNYAHQLFQPFQRLHRASEFEGLGIGLSIVSRIVKRHGGRIWGDSAPGQGAVFRFTLGRAGEPAAASAPGVVGDEQLRRSAVPA